jgi:excisionase family DNA binding protein
MATRTANMQLDGSTLLTDQPEFMTVQQSAELLNVSKWLLYEAIRLGELPVIRWGRRVVVERNQLRLFLLTKRDPGQTAQ